MIQRQIGLGELGQLAPVVDRMLINDCLRGAHAQLGEHTIGPLLGEEVLVLTAVGCQNLVCGAIVTPMEGAYGNQERHPGRFAGGA